MSIEIKITIDAARGDQPKQLEEAMAALGYVPRVQHAAIDKDSRATMPSGPTFVMPAGIGSFNNFVSAVAGTDVVKEPAVDIEAAAREMRKDSGHSDPEGLFTLSDPVGAEPTKVQNTEPARTPGQPGPGRKRRTKEEMAEDEAFFAAAGKELASLPFAPVPDEKPAISTGGPRVDPADAAQDKADEKAEHDAARGDKLTLEDVRAAVAAYTAVVGIPVAQRTVPALLGGPIASIPDDQDALRVAVAAIEAAKNAATKEKTVETVVEKPKTLADQIAEALKPDDVHATMDDVVEGCKAYARKFDGQDTDLAKAEHLQTDIPDVLEKALGVRTVGALGKDPKTLGRALTAINLAVTTNPFKRGVK